MDSFFKQDLISWAFLILETPGRMDVTYNRLLQIYFLCVALLRGSSRGHHPVAALLSTLLHAFYGSHEKMIMTRFLTHQRL